MRWSVAVAGAVAFAFTTGLLATISLRVNASVTPEDSRLFSDLSSRHHRHGRVMMARSKGRNNSQQQQERRHLRIDDDIDAAAATIECTPPSQTSNNDNADITDSECPMGQFCKESPQSLLGGYCHNQVHVVEEAMMQQQVVQKNPPFGRRERERQRHLRRYSRQQQQQ